MNKIEPMENPVLPVEDSGERLRLALDAANMGDWSWDVVTGAIDFSPKAAEISGLPHGGIYGWDDIQNHLHPEDRDHVFNTIQKAISQKSACDVEYRYLIGQGNVRWVSIKGKAISGQSGDVVKVAAILQDITGRKLIEEKNALYQKKTADSEARYRLLADAMPQLVWTTHNEGFVNHYNNQTRYYTLNTTEHHEILIHPDDIDATNAAWEEAITTKTRYQCEHRIQMADGTYRRHLSRAVPVNDPVTGKVTWFGTATDTEDLYRLQDELVIVQESLSLAMLSGKMGWWVRDTVTDAVIFSPEMSNMFGLEPGEFRGTKEHYFEMLNPDDTVNNGVIIEDAIKKGIDFVIEFRFRHKNGTWGWMEGRGRAFKSKYHKNPQLYGIAIDITDRKLVEARLTEAKALSEAASNAKSDFLANMSHEFRTPLNAVVGITEILGATPLSEKQKQFLHTLKVSSAQLLGLIDDLLDVAKLESFSMKLENTPFDLDEIIDTVVTINKVRADKKNLLLQVTKDFDPSLRLLGDPLRLKQILMNLLGNAVKFTSQGSVNFTIEANRAATSPDLIEFTFTISDTGIGIDPKHRDSIFTKFSQGETSMARRFGGSGLGLHIAKSFIDLMGGTVDVTSTMGQGSQFVVTLFIPVYKEQPPALPVALPSTETPAKKIKALLVEDYEPNIIVAGYFIEDLGGEYDIARTGLEAIEKCKSGTYDFILMDVQMPGMNGYEATRQIRLDESGLRKTPIIGMTANALKGDKAKCLESGMDDYISKPFERRDLITMIEKYTGTDR